MQIFFVISTTSVILVLKIRSHNGVVLFGCQIQEIANVHSIEGCSVDRSFGQQIIQSNLDRKMY